MARDMDRVIRQWPQSDEVPTAAAPLGVDDGDSWWSGAQRSFVGIAIAGAAAALGSSVAIAGTFIQADDFAPPAAAVVDDGEGWLPSAKPAPPVSNVWTVPDEIPTAATPLAAHDEPWGAWLLPVKVTVAPMVWTDTDEVAPTTPGAGGGLPFYGQRARFTPQLVRWAATDDLPVAAAPMAADEDYWPAPSVVPAPPWTRAWAVDEDIAPVALPMADDDPWQAPVVVVTSPARQVWAVDDVLAQVAVPAFEDDAYPSLASPQPVTVVVWAEDEPIVPSAPTVDEAYWQQPFLAPPRPFTAPTFDDDVAVPQPVLAPEEEHWHRLFSVPVEPVVRLWHQQDEIATPATPLTVDEVYWERPVIWPAPAPQPANAADDEIVPQPTFCPVEEYELRLFSVSVSPLIRLWGQQDEITTAAPFIYGNTEVWFVDARGRVWLVERRTRVWPVEDH